MQQLDQPVGEQVANECGDMPAAMPTPNAPATMPPSMSINMNAQGMENIADILKLIAKVNPDTAPKEPGLPMMSMEPTIASISPADKPSPLKMLPDLSDEPGSAELQGEPEKKEEYANEPDEEVADIDAVIPNGTDLNREKGTYPKVAGGDNPMQRMESKDDLRAKIKEELTRRLAEAKGVK